MEEGKGMLWVDGGGGGEVKGVGLFIGSIVEFCRSPLRPSPRPRRTLRPALRISWAHPCCLYCRLPFQHENLLKNMQLCLD